MRDRSSSRRGIRAGMVGGAAGAAAVGIVWLAGVTGPSQALAQTAAEPSDHARGFISAAEQRKQIVERLDRIALALERINRRLEQGVHVADAPPAAR
ncbi:MAG: hypothetical protein ACTS27_09580 [Phycisphaerales bacterium]